MKALQVLRDGRILKSRTARLVGRAVLGKCRWTRLYLMADATANGRTRVYPLGSLPSTALGPHSPLTALGLGLGYAGHSSTDKHTLRDGNARVAGQSGADMQAPAGAGLHPGPRRCHWDSKERVPPVIPGGSMAGAIRGDGGGGWMAGWLRQRLGAFGMTQVVLGAPMAELHHQRLPMSYLSRLKQRINNIRRTGNPVPLALDAQLRRLQERHPKKKQRKAKTQRRKSPSFYNTRQWKELRYKILVRFGARCQCCGATAKDGAKINVDHIVPLSRNWERRLDESNLQVLCGGCNMGKGATDMTDWRASFDMDATDRI